MIVTLGLLVVLVAQNSVVASVTNPSVWHEGGTVFATQSQTNPRLGTSASGGDARESASSRAESIVGRWRGTWCGLNTANLTVVSGAAGLTGKLETRPVTMTANATSCDVLKPAVSGSFSTLALARVQFDGVNLTATTVVVVEGKRFETPLRLVFTRNELTLPSEGSGMPPTVFIRIGDAFANAGQAPVSDASGNPAIPAASSPTPDIDMTNAGVIDLLAKGVSAEIVALAIRAATKTSFDTRPAALVELTGAGVPDVVIAAMIEGVSRQSAVDRKAAVDASAARTHEVVSAKVQELESQVAQLRRERDTTAADIERAASFNSLNDLQCNDSTTAGKLNCFNAQLGKTLAATSQGKLQRLERQIQDLESKISALRSASPADAATLAAVTRDESPESSGSVRVSASPGALATSESRQPRGPNSNDAGGKQFPLFHFVTGGTYHFGVLTVSAGRIVWNEENVDDSLVAFGARGFMGGKSVMEGSDTFDVSCSELGDVGKNKMLVGYHVKVPDRTFNVVHAEQDKQRKLIPKEGSRIPGFLEAIAVACPRR